MVLGIEQIVELLLGYLPNLGQALIILLVGIVMSRIVANITSVMLHVKNLDAKLLTILTGKEIENPQTYLAIHIYYVLLFLVILMFFGALGLGWVASLMTGFAFFVLIVLAIIAVFRFDMGEKVETLENQFK